tara:strand:+ start:235 stop:414 length:180 start_codon:yes stop_codon:yes gene_type:complete
MVSRSNINKQVKGKLGDVTGDNKVTQKDVLVARGVLKKQGDKFVAAQYGGQISKIKRRT